MEENKYSKFEPYLQTISRKLTLSKAVKREYIDAFDEVFQQFHQNMKDIDPLLKTYGKIIYTGSHAHKIKVGIPNEFDMNICIKLPQELYRTVSILNSPNPGYVQIKTTGLNDLKKHQNYVKVYKSVEKWIDAKGLLSQNDFRRWMESIVTKTLNELEVVQNVYQLNCRSGSYFLKLKKSGPAFTINVKRCKTDIVFDIDIVPSLYFEDPLWPCNVKHKYKKQFKDSDWIAVAKPFPNSSAKNKDLCWRPAFSRQEVELLTSNEHMKSTIRFMKQLRDTQNMPYIASYFINTIFMWERTQNDEKFWNKSLSYLFMHMLYQFKKYISDKDIPMFWDKKVNLLNRITEHQRNDCEIKLTRIIKDIERNYQQDPNVIERVINNEKMTNITIENNEHDNNSEWGTILENMEENKYSKFEPYLQTISRKLTLSKAVKREYIDAFDEVFQQFHQNMKDIDPLLKTYGKIIYTGSHAHKIKVGIPNEFDMNICIKLPQELYRTASILNSPNPGYVQIKTTGLNDLKKHQNYEKVYKSVEKWIDAKGLLSQNKFRRWMESIVTKTLNKLEVAQNVYQLNCRSGSYFLKLKKSGPAFTINVKGHNTNIVFDIDIVPSLYFEDPLWACNVKHKYKKQFKDSDWIAVAKPFPNSSAKNIDLCWRPAFSRQEVELLTSNEHMKSTIRFMKQLRDTQNMPYIASYFINTIFMWERTQNDEKFWNKSLSYLFMHMLYQFKKYISDKDIPMFWDKKLNLLNRITEHQRNDCEIKLTRIIKDIERNYQQDPNVIERVINTSLTVLKNYASNGVGH